MCTQVHVCAVACAVQVYVEEFFRISYFPHSFFLLFFMTGFVTEFGAHQFS